MSAIKDLNGRNVSAARVPSLKSIIGGKPVFPADVYAFNAVKGVLAGNYRSKDIARVRNALDSACKVLAFVGELVEAKDLGDFDAAEDICLAIDGTIRTEDYFCGIFEFLKRLFSAVNCGELSASILSGQDQKTVCSSLGLILWAFDAYEEIGDFITALLYGGSVRGWVYQICKGISAEDVAAAKQILEALSRFFAESGNAEPVAKEE